jgi:hypothetical protein
VGNQGIQFGICHVYCICLFVFLSVECSGWYLCAERGFYFCVLKQFCDFLSCFPLYVNVALTLTISTPSAGAHGWHLGIGKKWHNRAPASGKYTITLEDGHVRPKHVDE